MDQAEAANTATKSLLADMGVIGMAPIEPVVLAALVTAEPLLLIGPHGTAKSYLLNRIAMALGLQWRHYNASLLNFDDLVGYPLPNGNGSLQYVQTPSSIWGAEVVFLDEISRCRPDLQNKLFPIIHERRVQGILLDKLVYRWSAMNPPLSDGDEEHGYRGSEPLDQALADRFAFVVEMPEWKHFSEQEQEQVILRGEDTIATTVARRLQERIQAGRALLPSVREMFGEKLAVYIRLLMALLSQAELGLSPRRGGMLLRNFLAVHTARILMDPEAELRESCLMALNHSFPQRAMGIEVSRVKILKCHREAWQVAALEDNDPCRLLIMESDPLRRALRASRIKSLSSSEFSSIVADCLASLRPGGRHALAATLFESGAAGNLVAAVAQQCGLLYGLIATPQSIHESVRANSPRHHVWQRVVAALARMDPKDMETTLTTNLLVGLFATGELSTDADVDRASTAWFEARSQIKERAA
ncbi:MAG: MoxR family ATPase [Planctomycetota bacterium]